MLLLFEHFTVKGCACCPCSQPSVGRQGLLWVDGWPPRSLPPLAALLALPCQGPSAQTLHQSSCWTLNPTPKLLSPRMYCGECCHHTWGTILSLQLELGPQEIPHSIMSMPRWEMQTTYSHHPDCCYNIVFFSCNLDWAVGWEPMILSMKGHMAPMEIPKICKLNIKLLIELNI